MNPEAPTRSVRGAAIIIAIMLAGCLGSGPDSSGSDDEPRDDPPDGGGGTSPPPPETPPDPDVPPAPVPMLLGFSYEGCQGVEVRFTPPLEDAQAVLPDGYEAMATGGATGDTALVEYLLLGCDGFATASAVVNDTAFGHVAVRIEAPDGAPPSDEYWYRVRMMAEPGLMEAVWGQAGYPLYVANFSATPAPLPAFDFGDYQAQGLDAGEAATAEVSRTDLSLTDAGRLEWTGVRSGAGAVFQGRFQVADDDPLAASWQNAPPLQTMVHHTDLAYRDIDLWLIRSA